MDNKSSSIDEGLRAAYERTNYEVQELDFSLQIGENCPPLDQLLEEKNRPSAVFITACNPRSVALSEAENRERQQVLENQLIQSDWPYYHGRGIDHAGNWPAEESFLVLGPNRRLALQLAERYDQNAVVWYPKGGPAGILWAEKED